ncbi:MAG: VWA domain-containing protein [Ruminococcus sp.]|nr:VWA domain-containing protein [Ruminococcus sp.]
MMEKKKVIAILLAGALASFGLGGVHASAEETSEPETASVLEVTSVEEAVAALDNSTESVESEEPTEFVESTEPEEPVVTSVEEITTETTTTTTEPEDVIPVQEAGTTVTSVVTYDPVVTTVMTGEEQGSAPLNYYDDVVLMLDISGSMYGDPMDAMKLAATEICKSFLQNNPTTVISIVVFGSDVKYLPYSSDLTTLSNYISGLSDDGLTNMYGGMEQVKLILNNSNGERKSVIIMADGIPNEGSSDYTIDYGYDSYQNAALQFDNENLKTDATVYSIGFFHNQYSAENAKFVRDLASNPKYSYIVTDKNDLNGAFQMIFQQITEKPEGKTESSVSKDTPVVGTESTPKTSDKSMGVVIAVMALAGLGIVFGKRK